MKPRRPRNDDNKCLSFHSVAQRNFLRRFAADTRYFFVRHSGRGEAAIRNLLLADWKQP
jgi:hypothetical protein